MWNTHKNACKLYVIIPSHRQNCQMYLQGKIHVDAGRLTISGISVVDSGMYQCVAENKHGAAYASAELKVMGKQFIFLVCLSWALGRTDNVSWKCHFEE